MLSGERLRQIMIFSSISENTPMPRFAANLSMLYNEHAFLDRFVAAARDGFQGVEYLFQVIDTEAQQCNWTGWVGCEHRPALGAAAGATSRGLAWVTALAVGNG